MSGPSNIAVGRTLPALLAACLLAAYGCGRGGIGSVEELAEALRQHGVAYEVSETAALASIRAGGIRLMGENLKVEIYLIDDEKDMKLAATAAAFAAMGQSKVAGASPLKAYVRKPFLIIVRQEPVEGQVRAALESVFGE